MGNQMLTDTLYRHVVLNEQGVPIIEGTTMKVVELVLYHKEYGWDPSALQLNYPYLTMSQIYSALAFYWDNKETLDQDINRRLQRVDDLTHVLRPSRIREKLNSR